MLETFGFVALYIIFSVLFAALMIGLPVIFQYFRIVPYHPTLVKTATFECGMETIGKTWVQFNFHYYFYALIFVVMDVLVLIIYPWAVETRQLGYTGLEGVLVFIAIIMVGYLYAWKKGALEWK